MKERPPPEESDPKAFERFKEMTKRLLSVPKRQADRIAAKKKPRRDR